MKINKKIGYQWVTFPFHFFRNGTGTIKKRYRNRNVNGMRLITNFNLKSCLDNSTSCNWILLLSGNLELKGKKDFIEHLMDA